MVGGHDGFAVKLEQFGDNSRHAFIYRLYRFDSRFDHAAVADHVGIGEVKYDQIVVRHPREQLLGDFERAHLRFQIVSGDLWRRNQFAVFARKRLFDPSVKKIGDMRILFRLRDAQLPFAGRANDFTQDVGDFFRRENKRRRISHIVLR